MDFKIGDEIEDVENLDENGDGFKPSRKQSNLPLIIVIVVSIIIGLVVFFISNAIFGKKETTQKEPTSQKLSLTESNVDILYNYVTSGPKNTRGDKFLKEKNVTLQSFTTEEKFYYALQFADVEDFTFTGKLDDKKQKQYLIPNSKIKQYMQRFFGPTVTYSTNEVIKYPFSFRINGKNVGTMTYSEVDGGYITVFDSFEADVVDTDIVKPYYTALVGATKEVDGSYTLEEKVIYTKLETNEDKTYNISIYKDYENKSLIESKTNQTEEMLKANPISIDKYKSTASTITYKFKLNGNVLYFYSSEIK